MRILDTARATSSVLGDFADIWLPAVLEGDPISLNEIARRLGVSPSSAGRMASRLRLIAFNALGLDDAVEANRF